MGSIITLPPLAEVSNPQIEDEMRSGTKALNLKAASPGNLLNLLTFWRLSNMSMLDEQVGKNRFTSAPASCYIDSVAPVKRDRAWTPVESAATKAAVSAYGLRLFHSCPFMAARWAGASLAGSRKRVPGSPTHRAAALIGLRAAVFENRTCLEANQGGGF